MMPSWSDSLGYIKRFTVFGILYRVLSFGTDVKHVKSWAAWSSGIYLFLSSLYSLLTQSENTHINPRKQTFLQHVPHPILLPLLPLAPDPSEKVTPLGPP